MNEKNEIFLKNIIKKKTKNKYEDIQKRVPFEVSEKTSSIPGIPREVKAENKKLTGGEKFTESECCHIHEVLIQV